MKIKTIHNLVSDMQASGLNVDIPNLRTTGKLTRCGTTAKPRSKNGWYVVHTIGNFINAVFGAYGLLDEPIIWHNKSTDKLTRSDRTQIHAANISLQKRLVQQQTEKLINLRANYTKHVKPLTGSHPYLENKGISAWLNMSIADPLSIAGCIWSKEQNQYVIRYPFDDITKNVLIIPIRNINGELLGFQKINAYGGKYIHDGSQRNGNFYTIAPESVTIGSADRVFISESLSTGISVYIGLNELLDACIFAILVSFGVHNVENVCLSVWGKFPNKCITLLADNDFGTENNTGVKKCTQIVDKYAAQKPINMFIPEEV